MESIFAPFIRINGLTKQYHTRTGALDNVHLDIAEGEFIALVGPSGCGKTTLLKILAGLEGRFGGEAHLGDIVAFQSIPSVGA